MATHLTGISRADGGVRFTWSDGLESVLSIHDLRVGCPCAFCVNEVTGERMLDPATVQAGIGLKDMQPVGNYAYRLLFDDGHHTGLYTLDELRERCLEAVA